MPSSELSVAFCYVYLIYSPNTGNFYIGFTQDLRKRVAKHNRSLNPATKPYAPLELIYYEAHRSESDARRREKYLKTTPGRQALKRMLREQLKSWQVLSQQKVYY